MDNMQMLTLVCASVVVVAAAMVILFAAICAMFSLWETYIRPDTEPDEHEGLANFESQDDILRTEVPVRVGETNFAPGVPVWIILNLAHNNYLISKQEIGGEKP